MRAVRYLVVVADDYGIGPETSRAIVEFARRGVVTGTVLLANSPHAASAVQEWRRAGWPADLGWHPCLTMDAPTAPVSQVESLLGADGKLLPLGRLVTRMLLGKVRAEEIDRELRAQYRRFLELTGVVPSFVNSHQHVALFSPVGKILRGILSRQSPRPFLRRVQEPLWTLTGVPGARIKRSFLNLLGRPESRRQAREGFPGADWMVGVTDPRWVRDSGFWARWLDRVPGRVVELMCHPGYLDRTLIGRDCREGDGLMERRVDEQRLLAAPNFLEACGRAGFTLIRPSRLALAQGERCNAA